jgi:hypothetical protein
MTTVRLGDIVDLESGPAARGESPAALGRRRIASAGVAPRSNTGRILARRALAAARIATPGATRDFQHGLLGQARQQLGVQGDNS